MRKKIAPSDVHRRLLNVYGDPTVDVSTVRRWVAHFSCGDTNVKDKPRSGQPCTGCHTTKRRASRSAHPRESADYDYETRDKRSTLTATSRRWLSWRLEFPESGQRRIQPFSCNTTTPGPIPVWIPWSTLPIMGGLSYHTHCIVRIWPLLTSICSGRWKMDCVDNISLATRPRRTRCETVGHFRWCRFLRVQHAGSCSSLAKVYSQWWWLCRNNSVL